MTQPAHLRSLRSRIQSKPGDAPGTLLPAPGAAMVEARYAIYDTEELREGGPVPVEELPPCTDDAVLWVDIVGTADVDALQTLAARFKIHTLAVEDIVNVNQRPKLEAYEKDLFFVVRMCPLEGAQRPTETEQLCILLREGLVITFQERRGDCFEPVRKRLRKKSRRIRTRRADYLAYALLDAIIDAYQPVLEGLEERLEAIETRLLDTPQESDLKDLHTLRRDLIDLRRSVAPAKDVVIGLLREPEAENTITEETQLFLRDCFDHVARTVDQIDNFRELCASLMDLYLSTISNRTNDVMKVLTMIATVFIPLSFLVGLYGMNFSTDSPWNMPELSFAFGYPVLVSIMVVIAGGFFLFFKRKGWL